MPRFNSELGLLGLLGYRVGENGLPTQRRRKIISKVIVIPTEMVESATRVLHRSVDNIHEWGEAGSRKRIHKLVRTLEAFISLNEDNPSKNEAVRNWSSDLSWTRMTFLS
mgnify:CR=1 FL=1